MKIDGMQIDDRTPDEVKIDLLLGRVDSLEKELEIDPNSIGKASHYKTLYYDLLGDYNTLDERFHKFIEKYQHMQKHCDHVKLALMSFNKLFYHNATSSAVELAATHNIFLSDIAGSGSNGRILKSDVKLIIKHK